MGACKLSLPLRQLDHRLAHEAIPMPCKQALCGSPLRAKFCRSPAVDLISPEKRACGQSNYGHGSRHQQILRAFEKPRPINHDAVLTLAPERRVASLKPIVSRSLVAVLRCLTRCPSLRVGRSGECFSSRPRPTGCFRFPPRNYPTFLKVI